jgi:hypothetical protein
MNPPCAHAAAWASQMSLANPREVPSSSLTFAVRVKRVAGLVVASTPFQAGCHVEYGRGHDGRS